MSYLSSDFLPFRLAACVRMFSHCVILSRAKMIFRGHRSAVKALLEAPSANYFVPVNLRHVSYQMMSRGENGAIKENEVLRLLAIAPFFFFFFI